MTQGQPVDMAGLEVTFVRERQFTGLIVARDPGALFVWLGALLLVGGIALVFFFPSRRAWALIRRRPDGTTDVHVGAVVRHDVGVPGRVRAPRPRDRAGRPTDRPTTTEGMSDHDVQDVGVQLRRRRPVDRPRPRLLRHRVRVGPVATRRTTYAAAGAGPDGGTIGRSAPLDRPAIGLGTYGTLFT